METRKILVALSIKNKGNWEEMYNALTQKKNFIKDEEVDELVASIGNTKYITIIDKEYPETLKQTFKPPFVLFYQGDISLLNSKSILAIANQKESTKEDLHIAGEIENTDEDIVFALGGSGNIDEILSASTKHKSILITPTPIDSNYKKFGVVKNIVLNNNGLVITETPNGVELNSQQVIARYRIIAGISQKVLVVSSKSKEGIEYLVGQTLVAGKDVMVVPTSPLSNLNNNKFISEGAFCVYDTQSIQFTFQNNN